MRRTATTRSSQLENGEHLYVNNATASVSTDSAAAVVTKRYDSVLAWCEKRVT